MQLLHSHQFRRQPANHEFLPLLRRIREADLREWVSHIARPRHFTAESQSNRAIAEWLAHRLRALDYAVEFQGPSYNVVAIPQTLPENARVTIIGAHYDSVPNSPGADDNASAVASLLGAATALASTPYPVIYVAFNREEDGFIGSSDFVEDFFRDKRTSVSCAHILEMVGYASHTPGSQRLPSGLPVKLPDAGNFLGLLSNDQSRDAMRRVLELSNTYTPDLPVTGLTVIPGAERAFPVLARSDHVPFWARQIPALMWTDTAEFRNPNYHQSSDTPDTLNYTFLKHVTELLTMTTVAT